MKELLRSVSAYRAVARGEEFESALVLFADGKYLRALLKECAKAFFRAKDGSRTAELIDRESYSDCLIFPAEGEKLTVDDCAKIVEESLLRPVEGEKKLFVLDAFQDAAPLVQNKLLKILEEPPENVHFLLGATTRFSVLPTVLSRVKRYEIPPFSEEAVEGALSRKYPGRDCAAAASASGGVFSAGETLLEENGESFRLAQEFLSASATERFCREMGERKNKREFFAALKSLLRDMLFCATGQDGYVRIKEAGALAEGFPAGAISAAIGLVNEAEKQIQFNANFASCLYALALGIEEEKKKWQRLS